MKNEKKRTVLKMDDGNNVRVRCELMICSEAYRFARKMGGEWKVDVQGEEFSIESIRKLKEKDGKWFYYSGFRGNIIEEACDIGDEYYELACDRFSMVVLKKARKCYRYLLSCGFSINDVLYFIKKDGLYYLMCNDTEHGYLDDSKNDAMFKDMLTSIFKSGKCTFEVVVFPIQGESFIFKNTLIAYRTVEDFRKALDSQNFALDSIIVV